MEDQNPAGSDKDVGTDLSGQVMGGDRSQPFKYSALRLPGRRRVGERRCCMAGLPVGILQSPQADN